jgi:hypothetical protein
MAGRMPILGQLPTKRGRAGLADCVSGVVIVFSFGLERWIGRLLDAGTTAAANGI